MPDPTFCDTLGVYVFTDEEPRILVALANEDEHYPTAFTQVCPRSARDLAAQLVSAAERIEADLVAYARQAAMN